MNNPSTPSSCQQCGKCCSYEIPTTLLDLDRIAAYLDQPILDVFSRLVHPNASTASVFKMQKDPQGACLLLARDRRCSIHAVKPIACRLYSCRDGSPALVRGSAHPEHCALMWEQSVAMLVTQAYVRNNGCQWNAIDYARALESIRAHTRTNPSQTLKLARDGHGHSLSMIYDCSECSTPGQCAQETVVTLDDLRRMAKHLGITLLDVFQRYVAPVPGATSGCLVLRRGERCVLRGSGGRCLVEPVKPLHCRFTPCPLNLRAPVLTSPLYLGSGTLEQQYRHHIALEITREYVDLHGVRYNRTFVKDGLRRLDEAQADPRRWANFVHAVGPYRYVAESPQPAR